MVTSDQPGSPVWGVKYPPEKESQDIHDLKRFTWEVLNMGRWKLENQYHVIPLEMMYHASMHTYTYKTYFSLRFYSQFGSAPAAFLLEHNNPLAQITEDIRRSWHMNLLLPGCSQQPIDLWSATAGCNEEYEIWWDVLKFAKNVWDSSNFKQIRIWS